MLLISERENFIGIASMNPELPVLFRGSGPGALTKGEREMAKGTEQMATQRRDSSVAVIGLGPWGLSILERLVAGYTKLPEGSGRLCVHVVEPGPAGSGVFSVDQPEYFILNTPCGQHCLHPFPEEPDVAGLGRTFLEWAQARGYRWVDGRCIVRDEGREISGADFLPRRVMGEYLEWFYEQLVAGAPAGLDVVRHRTSALDVQDLDDARQRVVLADEDPVIVDHVVLTTGHTPNANAESRLGPRALAPYPVEQFDSITADQSVAVAGMGLVALDVMTALTTGRGGTFAWRDGRLRYTPSGQEPQIYLFSRSGLPYCAKSSGAADPTGEYEAVICTDQAISALRAQGPVDFRRDFLPLLFAEMEVAFHAQAALLHHGSAAAEQVRHELAKAWTQDCFETVRARWEKRHGAFCAADHFFGEAAEQYLSAKDYEAQVYDWLECDAEEAVQPGGVSPTKRAYEVLRVLRDTTRTLVEFQGLTLESYLDFQSNLRNRITRLVAGPPVSRSQELLALLDAGIVQLPFGPSPSVESADDAGFVIASCRLERPVAETVDWLIQGHLDDPTCHRSSSPLLTSLYRRGRIRQLSYGRTPVGSIYLSTDFHPVNSAGRDEQRLWVFGALSEGTRHFTHYIPSPKSRVRAFLDGQVCVDTILADTGSTGRSGKQTMPLPPPSFRGVA